MSQKEKGNGRRSSILKPPKTRQPFMELADLKPMEDDDGATTETMRSRRVSFSHKKGVALFTSDHGNTIWHNFYEENNKPDLSDSGGAAHFQVTMDSTKAPSIVDENDPRLKVGDDSYNESFQTNHDMTFAAMPDDDDDDEDRCVDIHAMLTGFSKPVERELPNIVFHTTLNTFSDQTEALINYKITQDSSKDPLCFESSVKDEPRSISPGISTHFTSDVFGEHLDYTNIVAAEDSIHHKDIIFNESQGEMSITQGIPAPLQEIKEVFIKNNYYNTTFPNQEDLDDKENFKTHLMCDQNIENNIQEIQKPQVSKPTSILDQFQREFLLKDEDMLEEDFPISAKRALSEESRLDDSYILPDKMAKDNQTADNRAYFTDKRRTILFDQNSSNCDMEITYVNDNIKDFKSGMFDLNQSSYPATTGKDVANKNSRKTIHFNPNDSDCNMSMTNVFPRHVESTNNEYINVRQSIVDQKTSEFNMSMTCMNYNTSVDQGSTCQNDMSMTKVMTSNIIHENNVDIENDQVYIHKRNAEANVEYLEDHKKLHIMKRAALDEQDIKPIIHKMSENNIILPNEENKPFVPTISKIHQFHKHSKDVVSHTNENENKANISIPYPIDIEETKLESIMLKMSDFPKKDDRQSSSGHQMFEHLSGVDMELSITGVVQLAKSSNNYNNRRKTIVFDRKMPECNKSMTSVIPKINENERNTIVFDQKMPDCNMSMTSVIPSINENKRKTIVFDQKMPECNLSMTSVIPSIDEIKRKTIVFDQNMPECNMSITSVIPSIDENKRKTIVFDQKMPDCNMSMTSVIPSIDENKRKTIVFDQKMPDCHMSMTSVIPSIDENKRKTIVFDQKMPDCHMSMTSVIPSIDENKRKTIVFDQKMPDCNMSMTSVIPSIDENKRKTIVFDQKMPDCNMSMTSVIPSIEENKRKTIVFDQKMPECNMSITSVIPSIDENKRKTIVFDQKMPECKMSMTSVIPSIDENKRKTIVFDQNAPDCNMSMTSVIPNVNENDRKTILFDQKMTDCNMSMTSVIPSIDEIKKKTIVCDQKMPECNMSMTSVNPSIDENKRKTIVFDQNAPDCNMSMTSVIPNVNENDSKTIVFDQKMPDCNMSMTSVIPSIDENKRKTIVFDQKMPDCHMSMTSAIPSIDENKRKTIVFDQKMPDCNMSMTSVIPSIDENKRKTIVFDQKMPDCNMSMTSVIPSIDENKRKTIVFDQKMPECNLSMTSIIPSIDEINRKTIVFDQKMPECNMSMTSVIPSIDENKRKTIVFDQNMPDCNMSMTSVIPNVNENDRKTIVFDQIMPDCNMSMTSVISSIDENKRKTIVFDQKMPECNMLMTSVISSIVENKRKTIVFDQKMPECNMSMTGVIPSVLENKRKTIVFDQKIPECNMSMTSVISNHDENKRKTIMFDQKIPECNMSMTSVISTCDENKKKTIVFDKKMPECNMSTTSDIQNKDCMSYFENSKNNDHGMSLTGLMPRNNYWDSKNNVTSTSFAAYSPDINNHTRSIMPNVNYGPYRNVVSTAIDSSVPDEIFHCDISLPSIEENIQNTSNSQNKITHNNTDCHMSVDEADVSLPHGKMTLPLEEKTLPLMQLTLPHLELTLPHLELTREEKTLPRMELALPRLELTLPPQEVILPPIEITLPHNEINLPHMEMTLPCQETVYCNEMNTLPCMEKTLPRLEMALPHNESTLPCLEKTLPCMEMTLPCMEISIPNKEKVLLPVEVALLSNEMTLRCMETTLPRLEITLPPVEVTLPLNEMPCMKMDLLPVEVNLPHNEVTLPCVEMTLPSVEVTLPLNDMTLPSTKMDLPPVEVKLPHNEVTLPCMEMTLPCMEMTLPRLEMTLPPDEITLPLEMTLPCMKMDLPPVEVNLPHNEVTFPCMEMTLPRLEMTLPPVEVTLPLNETTLPCMEMTLPRQAKTVEVALPLKDVTLPSMDMNLPPDEVILTRNEMTLPSTKFTTPPLETTLPSVKVPSTLVDVTTPGLEIDSPHYQVASPCHEMSFPRVEMYLPPVEVILPIVEAKIMTTRNNLSDNVSTEVYKTVSTRDLSMEVEDHSGTNVPGIMKDESFCDSKNQSKTNQNCSIQSNDLVCEVATLKELNSNPSLKLTNEMSDSSEILIDSPKMKKIEIVVNPFETSGKRKSDLEYSDESFNVPKKQKVLPLVCSWLKDVTLEEKVNTSKVGVNVSQYKYDIIDTMTYTVTTPHFINSGGIEVVEKETKIGTSENIEAECNNSDHLIANISDMSLVNSSFDRSDPKHRHEEVHPAEEPTPKNAGGINIRGIIDSVDEIIRRQCGLLSPQKERKSFCRTPANQSLPEDSLCESTNTTVDSVETPQKSPEKPLIVHPKFIPIPTKQIVEELIRDLNLNTNLCTLDLECTEGNECVFLLMRNAIKMTVVLQTPLSGVSSTMRPVHNIVLEAMNVKYLGSKQKFHRLAATIALQQLDAAGLRDICQVAGDLGRLVVRCSKVAAEAWSWSRHCYLLHVKYNLHFENDRWTFEICNGLLLSIWEFEIRIPLSSLPHAKPEDVKITAVTGNSSIKDSDFRSAIGEVSPSWHYIPNLIAEMNKLIVSHSKSLPS